jgi:peptide deformylase
VALPSIILFPDPRLRLAAPPVTAFDDALRALVGDLVALLDAVPAIGLTGPHIGVLCRATAIRLPGESARVYVNPRVIAASTERASHPEGSVSMPGIQEAVERPARITLHYQDLDGAAHEAEIDGFAAACCQHEIDQLDGVFWLERLSRLKRERAIKRFDKLGRRAPTPVRTP